MKNVGKPCDREGHARIDGRELETEQRQTTDTGKNDLAGNHETTSGPETYRRTTPPRQLSTLHGRFYKSMLYPVLRRLNRRLVHWACRKYKRLKRRERKAMHWLAEVARRAPRLFAHWRFGLRPDGWAMGDG